MWLSEVTSLATSSSADKIDVVIATPEDDDNNDILLADVASQIDVHEYNNINDEENEDVFDKDELKLLKKKSKSKSVSDKPKKNLLLNYNQ